MLKFFLISSLILLLSSCGSYNNKQGTIPSILDLFEDKASWYFDQKDGVENVNITVPPAPNTIFCAPYNNTTAVIRPCTLLDIENDTNAFDDYIPELSVFFQTDSFKSSNEAPNAILKQKGKSTRSATQKSYKIKLNSKTEFWNNERRIQFNKQFFDLTRIRNKLAFDIFEGIPNFASLKTEFVHLTLNTQEKGLFTKVESYDMQYLLNRGWNKDDNLYKAQNFYFYLQQELALNSSGTPINLTNFNKILEVQRGKKQTKLIEMLKAVQNKKININAIIAQYFNRDNYLTWLAINIIVGNVDTITQNYFLLNPLYSDKFYFLPWDYDDAFGWANQLGRKDFYVRWELSYARWWDSPLHRRFLSVKKNRDDLNTMLYKLRTNYLTNTKIQAKINSYKPLVLPYIISVPDKEYLSYREANITKIEQIWETECDILTQRVQENIDEYERQKGSPMPFWQSYIYIDGLLTLIWDESIDFEKDSIVYDVSLSHNYDFNTTLVNKTALSTDTNELNLIDNIVSYSFTPNPKLNTGDTLYVRVISKETNNALHYQIAFDKFVDDTGKLHPGVLKFVIK